MNVLFALKKHLLHYKMYTGNVYDRYRVNNCSTFNGYGRKWDKCGDAVLKMKVFNICYCIISEPVHFTPSFILSTLLHKLRINYE